MSMGIIHMQYSTITSSLRTLHSDRGIQPKGRPWRGEALPVLSLSAFHADPAPQPAVYRDNRRESPIF